MSWRMRAAERVLLALSQRAVGHTWAMKEGAYNTDCWVVFPDHRQATQSGLGARAVSLDGLDALYGSGKPVLLDHSTVEVLLRELLEANRDLRERLAGLEAQ